MLSSLLDIKYCYNMNNIKADTGMRDSIADSSIHPKDDTDFEDK